MKKFLLPMGSLALSKETISIVESFLTAWPESSLTVLHVIPEIRPDSVYPYYSMLSREVARENALAGEIESAVQDKLFPLYRDRIEFSCVIGNPVHSICDVALDTQVDMIVLDNTSPSVIDRMLLGSVSYGVVHHAKVPVVLVKHESILRFTEN